MILYRIVRLLILGLSKALWRARFEGGGHVPAEGPYVLAPVHRSFIDFGLASCVTTRRMGFMGKDSLWKSRALGWFISTLGAYPVRRGAPDREAMRRTLDLLEAGVPVVMFPEGTRRSGPVVADLHEGAAYVACRAGVPVVPVGIGGSERALEKGRRLPRLVKVVVLVGEPILPPRAEEGRRTSRRAVRELTAQLEAELQRLFDRAQAEAGVPNPPAPGGAEQPEARGP